MLDALTDNLACIDQAHGQFPQVHPGHRFRLASPDETVWRAFETLPVVHSRFGQLLRKAAQGRSTPTFPTTVDVNAPETSSAEAHEPAAVPRRIVHRLDAQGLKLVRKALSTSDRQNPGATPSALLMEGTCLRFESRLPVKHGFRSSREACTVEIHHRWGDVRACAVIQKTTNEISLALFDPHEPVVTQAHPRPVRPFDFATRLPAELWLAITPLLPHATARICCRCCRRWHCCATWSSHSRTWMPQWPCSAASSSTVRRG